MQDYCFHCGRWRFLKPGCICADCLDRWFTRHVHRALP